ncbi:MAG: glycoside hydrolase family 43 protein [Gracilimonas sp.]|uniref:glycoside hydrolase family 43 protein n=1 Tax=Gracilimonas sp. TaxID=1974203 RepID=UPI0019C9D359|nr:glycoside hydrolase family 43 protein [Gracilimonas sp.]MBD3617355.1 glycoside hydrolase family 43 protein [Gracilimonas sp.]
MKSLLLLIIFSFSFVGCSSQSVDPPKGEEEPSCVFTNPVAEGADPWIIRKDKVYYSVKSVSGGIQVSKSEHLTEVLKSQQRAEVWRQPSQGWNRQHLWAPELHYVQGEWFIYYTAGESGPPFISQRSGVLRATSGDPLGDYEDMGMLYTGDNIETLENEKWAIDLTVLEHAGNLYAIWSGWEENAETDRTPQHLYIAEMENPWTISSNRVKISSPEEPWETGTELAINEGPEILKNGGQTFVIYSASESWLPAYNLGQLELVGDDPMDPASWEKSGSVFSGSGQVYGTGHASFTKSPDGSESWIAFHTKIDEEPGWDRVVYLQSFSWNEDGSPDFGTPVQPGNELQRPSGECETE